MHRSTVELIEQQLHISLKPNYLRVIDESDQHIGHPGAKSGGGHFRVIIYAKSLQGLSRINQHRQINQALQALFSAKIHALAIEVLDKSPHSDTL